MWASIDPGLTTAPSASIDDSSLPGPVDDGCRANGNDPPLVDRHRTVEDLVVAGVHSQNVAVADDKIDSCRPATCSHVPLPVLHGTCL